MSVDVPIGADLCSGTTPGDTLPNWGAGYEEREITLGAGVELVEGVTYAIVVRAPDAVIGDSDVIWALKTPDGYADGDEYKSTDSGVSWVKYNAYDAWFKTKAGAVEKDTYTPAVANADDAAGVNWLAQTFIASSTYTITSVILKLERYTWDTTGTVTVSIKAVVPSGNLFEYYNDGDDTYLHAYTSNRLIAQTFTSDTEHHISFVRLKLFKVGDPGTFSIGIRKVNAGTGKPTGGDLCTGTYNGNSLTTSVLGAWYTITLGDGYTLSASTQYAIVLYLSGGDISNAVRWLADSSSPTYAGGQGWYSTDGGSSWLDYSNYDFLFEEWSSYEAPEITDQSGDVDAKIGEEINLSITATGDPDPTYQWYKNDVIMSGETDSTLTIYPTSIATYKCIVTNITGSDTSDPIIVTVVSNPYVWNPFDIPLDISRTD